MTVGAHVYSTSINGIRFDVWEHSARGRHIEVEVDPASGRRRRVAIGGGARLSRGAENLLTAIYPGPGGSSWIARAKDHLNTSTATLTVRCITAEIADEDVYVAQHVDTKNTGIAGAPARLPKEYALIGGGAQLYFEKPNPPYPGSLMLYSWQVARSGRPTTGWSRPRIVVSTYAIGLSRDLLKRKGLQVIRSVSSGSGPAAAYPANHCTMKQRFPYRRGCVTGGGAQPFIGSGNNLNSFLTASWPTTPTEDIGWGWAAASKDHGGVSSPGWINACAFAVVWP